MAKGPIVGGEEFDALMGIYEEVIDAAIKPGLTKAVVSFSESMAPSEAVRAEIKRRYTEGDAMWASASWEKKLHHKQSVQDDSYDYWELTLTA
jgi:hypothetical protein